MFIIPCKFTAVPEGFKKSYVARSVASIKIYHPDEKILVVDSDSDDVSYLEHLKKIPNVIAVDAKNKNWLDGALWHAYENYPDEAWYCVLQDTITIKHTFDEFINGEELFYSLMWFPETILGDQYIADFDKIFDGPLKKYKPMQNNNIIGCWGPCFLAKREILERLRANNLHLCMPYDKYTSNISERLWGMCVTYEGIDITQHTIDGDYLAIALPRELFNTKSKYHNKIYGGRQ
tara:strand:- start:663 stop:1364 length:702 start_codon:yes stop_codon:yes gene_type:complete